MNTLKEILNKFAVTSFGMIALTLVAWSPSPANAAIQSYDIRKSESFQQTSNVQPSSFTGLSGELDLFSNNSADFTTAQVTSAASPLSPISLSLGGFFTKPYASQGALDFDFPPSATYQFAIGGGSLGEKTASLSTPSADLFPSQVPFLSGSTFSHLQGMNSAAPFQFTFNGFTPAIGSTAAGTQLAISHFSPVGQFISDFGISGNSTLTSALLPANTLQPNTTYGLTLAYANEIITQNAGFNGAFSEILFIQGTSVSFTTAPVPEPSSLVLLGVGGVGLLAYMRRRRSAFNVL